MGKTAQHAKIKNGSNNIISKGDYPNSSDSIDYRYIGIHDNSAAVPTPNCALRER